MGNKSIQPKPVNNYDSENQNTTSKAIVSKSNKTNTSNQDPTLVTGSYQSKLQNILSLFKFIGTQGDKYVHKYLAFGDDDYGCVTHFKDCNKKQVFFGHFQCFSYDESTNQYFSWGLNNYGQLGQGKSTNYLSTNNSKYHFMDTLDIISTLNFEIDLKFQQIKIEKMSFGDGFTIACDNLNTIYSWGKSEDFQLGYDLKFQDADIVNGKKCRLNPTMVKKFDSKVVSMESGKDFTFVLTADKKVYAWGNNENQQIMPFKYFTQVLKPRQYKYTKCTLLDELTDLELYDIKCGWSHSIAICKKINKITSISQVDINFKDNSTINKIDNENNSNLNINERKVIIWGSIENCLDLDDFTELEIDGENPKSIVSGFSHSIIVTGLDNAFAIGDNTYVRFF